MFRIEKWLACSAIGMLSCSYIAAEEDNLRDIAQNSEQVEQSNKTPTVPTNSPPDSAILEFRVSYFYPTSEKFRDIYHDGGVNYQLTATVPLYYGDNIWARGIDIWAAVDYFSKEGHSTGLHDRTRVQLVPVTLGLKYFFPSLGNSVPVNFYLASGMKYYFVHTHNHSDFVRRTVNRNGMGGVVEAGFIATCFKHLVLDVFASYSFRNFGGPSPSNPAVQATGLNVSGVNVGAGIGYKF